MAHGNAVVLDGRSGPLFGRVTLRGAAGSILWGYYPAVVLRSWTITGEKSVWTLKGTAERVDAFMSRQQPLLFTAPKEKGHWAWVVTSLRCGPSTIEATLGQPEQ